MVLPASETEEDEAKSAFFQSQQSGHQLRMPASPSELSFLFQTRGLLGSILDVIVYVLLIILTCEGDFQCSGQNLVQTGRLVGKHVACSQVSASSHHNSAAQLFGKHTQTTSLIFIASTTASTADRVTPAHYFAAAAVANH